MTPIDAADLAGTGKSAWMFQHCFLQLWRGRKPAVIILRILCRESHVGDALRV
jgi:hypothetical protein